MADNVSISFGADTSGFLDGVSRVSAALGKISEVARATGSSQQDVARSNLTAINGEIAAEHMAFTQKQSLYTQLTRLKIMSGGERVAATQAALDAEYAAESALLQKEALLDGLRPSQRQAVLNRMAQLDQKYAADSQRLMLQSAEQMVAPWNHMIDSMSSSMSSSLSGMILGTKNLQQALRSVTTAVVSQFVKMGVDVVADWTKKQLALVALSVAGEGQKTAAATSGAAARTGLAGAEAAGEQASIFSSVLHSITASASEAFAGVFGFLAPVMGPAAAGPAAAAQSAVMSVGAYDIGAWSIPQDQLAMVHQNELIMPAAEAGAFRSMLSNQSNGAGQQAQGGGDTHVHLNVSAMDAASVKNWLGSNSRQIMKAMNQAVRNGDHIGLRRLGQ